MSTTLPPTNKNFYLFGYPIAHSAAPSLHNNVFDSLKSGNKFGLWSTSKVTDEAVAEIRSDDCGGCAYV